MFRNRVAVYNFVAFSSATESLVLRLTTVKQKLILLFEILNPARILTIHFFDRVDRRSKKLITLLKLQERFVIKIKVIINFNVSYNFFVSVDNNNIENNFVHV